MNFLYKKHGFSLMMNQARAFGPKGKPAAGGGGAAAAPYVEPKKIATVFEKMISMAELNNSCSVHLKVFLKYKTLIDITLSQD